MPLTVPNGKDKAYIAFPIPVLRFILLECLCNSLSFLSSWTKVRVEYIDDGFSNPKILVKVINDISKPILIAYQEAMNNAEPGSGVRACVKAAYAAEGTFEHSDPTPGAETYTTTITLPVHAMPEQLWRFMK
jgi:hypothetical protein